MENLLILNKTGNIKNVNYNSLHKQYYFSKKKFMKSSLINILMGVKKWKNQIMLLQ